MSRSFVRRALLSLAVAIPVLIPSVAAHAQLRVVTSTTDLYDIARTIGGSRITAKHISEGYQDPHFVEAKPSFILELRRADVWAFVGLDLEVGWMSLLLDGSRNAKVRPGGAGYLDVSKAIAVRDVPVNVDRSQGDVHPQGNPHYWLDPGNGLIMARTIADRLSQLRPADRDHFAARFADFERRLNAAQARWNAALAPFQHTKVVTYHNSWPNFAERFGLDVIGYVEPKPGIPPPAAHIVALIGEMRRQQIKVVIVEPYFDLRTPESVARETGATLLVLPPSVGGAPEAANYIALFDHLVGKLAATLRAGAGK